MVNRLRILRSNSFRVSALMAVSLLACGTGASVRGTDDRAALESLFEATGGANWVNNDGWLTDRPLGDWYGVTVDPNGRVVRLELSGAWDSQGQRWVRHGLTGKIPPTLGNLSELQVLDLNLNELSGPIPAELGDLTRLEKLELPNNNLAGTIPPELGELSDLLWLSLGNNDLSGPIPVELANLTRVDYVDLGWNDGLCVPADPRLRAWLLERNTSLLPCPRDDGVRLLPRALMREDGNGLSLWLPVALRDATVSISDSTIVEASIDGGWLRLVPHSPGSALVTRHRTDEACCKRPRLAAYASVKRGWRALRTPGAGGASRASARKCASGIIRGATQPPEGRTRWSVRSMARARGVEGHGAAAVAGERHQAARDPDVQRAVFAALSVARGEIPEQRPDSCAAMRRPPRTTAPQPGEDAGRTTGKPPRPVTTPVSHNLAALPRGAGSGRGNPVVTGRETHRGPFGGKGC